MFRFPWKAPDQTQSAGKKVFWQMILHSYLCNTLLRFSSKSKAINVFPKHSEIKSMWPIKSSKEKIVLSCDSKNYLSNVWWKFLIKIQSMWRCKIKEQTCQLTSLYRGTTVRSSHQKCCIRKQLLKILQDPQETPVLESIFLKNWRPLDLQLY